MPTLIQIRIPDADKALIERAATIKALTVSAFMRSLAVQEARTVVKAADAPQETPDAA